MQSRPVSDCDPKAGGAGRRRKRQKKQRTPTWNMKLENSQASWKRRPPHPTVWKGDKHTDDAAYRKLDHRLSRPPTVSGDHNHYGDWTFKLKAYVSPNDEKHHCEIVGDGCQRRNRRWHWISWTQWRCWLSWQLPHGCGN